jgi:hypothetical protein
MNQILIRNVDETTIHRLKQLAWQAGLPFEEMAALMLAEAVRMRAALQRPSAGPLQGLSPDRAVSRAIGRPPVARTDPSDPDQKRTRPPLVSA